MLPAPICNPSPPLPAGNGALLPPSLATDWAANCSHHLALVQVSPVKAFNLMVILVLSAGTTASVCRSEILRLWSFGSTAAEPFKSEDYENWNGIMWPLSVCPLSLAPALHFLFLSSFLFFLFKIQVPSLSRSPVNRRYPHTITEHNGNNNRIISERSTATAQICLKVRKSRHWPEAAAGRNTDEEQVQGAFVLSAIRAAHWILSYVSKNFSWLQLPVNQQLEV